MASSSEAGGGAIRSRSERLLNGLAPDGTALMGEDGAATPDEAAKHGRGDGDPHMDERGSRTGGRGAQKPVQADAPDPPATTTRNSTTWRRTTRANTTRPHGRCTWLEATIKPSGGGNAQRRSATMRGCEPTTSRLACEGRRQ